MPTKLEKIRGLAAKIAGTVSAITPDADLAVPALCSVIFEIASNGRKPGFARKVAESLHMMASLLEEHENTPRS